MIRAAITANVNATSAHPASTEAAAYFCAVALLARLGDTPARVELALDGGCLVLQATGRTPEPGDVDASAIVDRAEAAGGRITVERDAQGRFRARIELPVPPAQVPDADDQTAASRSVPKADLTT